MTMLFFDLLHIYIYVYKNTVMETKVQMCKEIGGPEDDSKDKDTH